MLVSTNWDTVVDEAIKNIPGIKYADGDWNITTAHLHGSYLNPDTLYLPTEVTRELYRTPEEDQAIGNLHGSIMRSLIEADKVILYGLSVSALDAELSQTLGAGLDTPNLKCVEIIDPDHENIAERINLLIKYPTTLAVHGYNPWDLNKKFDYSK